MTERNWDKELAKIDKQLSSISDDELVRRPAAAPAAAAGVARGSTAGSAVSAAPAPPMWGVMLRVVLAVALAVSVPFWPYSARCGPPLAGYLAAVAVVLTAGTWAAIYTWRAQTAKAHIAALLVIAWGASLGATEILPRTGYARDSNRSGWVCVSKP